MIFPTYDELLDWAGRKDKSAYMQSVVGCNICPFHLALVELRDYPKEGLVGKSSYLYNGCMYILPIFAIRAIIHFDSKGWDRITFGDFINILKKVGK